MVGRSIRGGLEGTRLEELTVARKVRWSTWLAEHPDTLVLSVDGREDQPSGYNGYFASGEGFRGLEAAARQLDTKAPIYAFRLDGRPFAVPHAAIAERAGFAAEGRTLFLHRAARSKRFDSTSAMIIVAEPCAFDADSGTLEPIGCATPLTGFDTFWYNWSLDNPETDVLGTPRVGNGLRPLIAKRSTWSRRYQGRITSASGTRSARGRNGRAGADRSATGRGPRRTCRSGRGRLPDADSRRRT